MRFRHGIGFVLGLLGGCGGGGGGANPPGPPVDTTVPAEIAAGLPADDQGRPILIETPSTVSPGERIVLVYDEDLDDPISRWGWCLERVASCYDTNAPGPVSGCIDLIETCADDTGGRACCAPACIAEYHRQRDLGLDEMPAIDASFVRGDCLVGLAAQRGTP